MRKENIKGQINATANFQIEDFKSENAIETGNFDSLTKDINDSTSLGILNTKLENSIEAKDKKNEMSFSVEEVAHILKTTLSGNTNQDDNVCATYNGKSHIPKLLKSRDSINISSYKKNSIQNTM
ncbi:MAG: hypothetical protein ACR5KV_02490 [Wolbachia sp.]